MAIPGQPHNDKCLFWNKNDRRSINSILSARPSGPVTFFGLEQRATIEASGIEWHKLTPRRAAGTFSRDSLMTKTEILEIDRLNPQPELISKAAAIIRGGGLVAFPTETVYGLGADATNAQAVRKIFEAKSRPPDNPLIIHVADRRMLDRVAREVSIKAEKLVERFWPGPLTLVMPRAPDLPPDASAGLNTVAVRMPSAPVALHLIRSATTPIAAPSANVSGRPSPTRADHVRQDLDGKIELILDGGATTIGIESTVIDMTVDPPVILRPGWVTSNAIREAIGPIGSTASDVEQRHSPGTRHKHYSPWAPVVLIERGSGDFIHQVCGDLLSKGRVGYLGHTPTGIKDPNFIETLVASTARDYAASIYSGFRRLDESGADVIVVEGIAIAGEGEAVMDRLRRAASQVIIESLDAKERMETIEGIRRGLESMKASGGKTGETLFSHFFSKHDIPEE
jgi:L-threonylcarbamoyladenylate synthase